MDEQKKPRVKDFLYGVILAFFFYSLSFSISAIYFSEKGKPNLALDIIFYISLISCAAYLLLEAFVFSKSRSSSFSIGYFGAFAVGTALVFFITNIIPLDFVFDHSGFLTATFFRTACLKLCLCNAVMLVLKLGRETFRYVRSVFSGN